MSAIGTIIVFLAVCWLLGSVKNAKKRKGRRKPTSKYSSKKASRKSADSSIAKIAIARRAQIEKEWSKNYRETGSDLAQIADCCDNDHTAPCAAWHGRIISVFGKVPGFATLSDLDAEAIFGGELSHNLEYVDETVDSAEIALQKAHPIRDKSPEGLRRNLYEIDIERYVRKGMSRARAVVAVARDRLEREMRVGLAIDTRPIMPGLTDSQVLSLCPDGVPSVFEPFKATKKEIREGAHESYKDGTVTIKRDGLTAERIMAVCRL